MKKIYSFFALALIATLCIGASAAALTVTVKINDSSLALVQQYYYASGKASTIDLEFTDNECVVEYPDNSNSIMRYIYVTPITPEGGETIYYKSYKIYDSENVLIKEAAVNATTKKYIALPATADGGVVEIECGVVGNQKLAVNIDGDPAKVRMEFDGSAVTGLIEGAQSVEFAPGTRYLYVKPIGQSQFVSVKYNGTDVKPSYDAAEGGSGVYGYTVSSPADGATLDIVTDYPDKDCAVTIDSNGPAYLTEVKVNNEVVEDWSDLTVKAGDEVAVQFLDRFNYKVLSCGINGETSQYKTYSLSAIVTDDITFNWEFGYVYRDDSFVFVVQDDTKWYLLPSNLDEGCGGFEAEYNEDFGNYCQVPMREQDNPILITLDAFPASVTESDNIYIFVNNDLVEPQSGRYLLSVSSMDFIKGYICSEQPTLGHVTFTLDGLDEYPFISYDMMWSNDYMWDSSEGFDALPGTAVTIMGDSKIGCVSVDGEELELDPESGYYSFVATGKPMNVVISKDTSSVDLVAAESHDDLRTYNLMGVEVKGLLAPGVYIRAGKKIVIK